MNAPLITIGLPCFNAQDTVERAIDACLAQHWPNLEVIIVDDASTDRTAHIIEKRIATDGRARLVRHARNTGPAGTRNTILLQSRGEFIALFDDDDESSPDRVAEQLRTLTSYEDRTGQSLVACYASGERRYPNGYLKPLPAIGANGIDVPSGPGVADWLLFYRRNPNWNYGSGVPACALMARRSTFARVGDFDPALRRVEDVDFAIRLALLGAHFVGTSAALLTQHATNALDKTPEKNLEAEQLLATKHANYLRSVGRYEYAWRWPRLRYWHFKRRYDMLFVDALLLMLRNPIVVSSHLLSTAPKRILHEINMRRRLRA